jgi:hypothetical protein
VGGTTTAHKPKQLRLTQIVPGGVLDIISKTLHEVRSHLDIPQMCGCPNIEKYAARANEASDIVAHEVIYLPFHCSHM